MNSLSSKDDVFACICIFLAKSVNHKSIEEILLKSESQYFISQINAFKGNNIDSIHDQIHQKYLSSDTGFSLHYSFSTLCTGIEAKHVFEFEADFNSMYFACVRNYRWRTIELRCPNNR